MQVISDLVKTLAAFLANTLKAHWGKILLAFGSALIILIMIFPYEDLTILGSTQIYQATGLDTSAEAYALAFNPMPGAAISQLELNIARPPLVVEEARIFPSYLSSLLNGDFYFDANLSGVLGGAVNLRRRPGESIPESELSEEKIRLGIESLDLEKLFKFLNNATLFSANVPVQLKGSLSARSDMTLDPTLATQPNVELEIYGQNVTLPAQSIPTMMGPFAFPELAWSQVEIKGRWINGELIIEEATLGKPGEPLYARFKGKVALQLVKARGAGGVAPQTGAYEISADLNLTQSTEQTLGILLSLAQNFRTATSTGTRYLFRASGSSFAGPPRFEATSAF